MIRHGQVFAFLFGIATTNIISAQTWVKISGIADSTEIKQVAAINGQLVVAGQNWYSNSTTDFYTSANGNTWTKVPTYSYAGIYVWGLPQNNLLLSSSLVGSKKLSANAWTTFNNSGFGYAEFANGIIIGGNASAPGQLVTVSPTGVAGPTIGVVYKMGPKYCKASNNRLFLFSYGYGMAYIDYSNLSALVYPATLDGTSMTSSSWATYNIIDMIQLANGELIAADALGYGVLKSIDNGINWTTINTIVGPCMSITKNASNDVFLIANNKVWTSTNSGANFTDITGNIPPFKKVQLYVNSSNEVFCFNNGNNYQPSNSGIYKLNASSTGTTTAIIEHSAEENILIYPNPSTGLFSITLPESLVNAKISVFDVFGKEIFSRLQGESIATFQQQGESGIYFVLICKGEKIITKKLIIQ